MEGPLGETPPSLPGKGSRRAWRSLNPASWGLQLATVGSEDTTQDVKGLGTPGLRGAGVRVGTLMGNTRRRGKLGLEQAPLSIQGSPKPSGWSFPWALTSGTCCPSFGWSSRQLCQKLEEVAQHPPAFLAGLKALSCPHPLLLTPQLGRGSETKTLPAGRGTGVSQPPHYCSLGPKHTFAGGW